MAFEEERVSSIFIVPFIQCLVGILLVIALLNGQRDLVILTFLVLGIMAASRLWSHWSLKNLRIRMRIDKQRAFPDEKLTLSVYVDNKKWFPVRLQVNIPVDIPLLSHSNESIIQNECGLLWYQKTVFQWDLTARQRGLHHVGPPHIRSGDLFGFFFKIKKTGKEPVQVIVYPRIIPLKPSSFLRKDFFGIPGAKSPVQDPIYILGTRDYQHWQPARYIHWKASARHNKLQEKVFEPSSQEKILLLVDVESFAKNNAHDDFEKTLEAVASLAVQCDQKRVALGLLTNGEVLGGRTYLPVSRGPNQLSAILEVLARMVMRSDRLLIHALCDGLSLDWGVSGVCFSYQVDQDMHDLEGYFLNRKIPMMFMICTTDSSDYNTTPMLRSKVRTLKELQMEDSGP